jgi:cysteine-rich repeat protein
MRRCVSAGIVVGIASGCGDASEGGGPATDGSTSTASTGEPDDESTTSGPPDTTSSDPAESDTEMMTTVPQPDCGNGTVEPPEECDDGNMMAGDGCEPDCTLSVDTQQWEDVVGGAASVQDGGHGIATDGAGNVYAVGYIIDAVGDAQIWLRKYDSSGAEQFTETFDPSMGFDDRGYGVDVDSGGNIVIVGAMGGAAAESDIWLAKLDPQGVELWSTTVAGPEAGADGGTDVVVDAADNVIAVGYLRVGNGDNDMWIAKYDPAGVAAWTQTVAGPDVLDDRAQGVDVDVEDNVLVVGFVSNEGFNRDVWIRKYDPAGEEVWTTVYDSVLSGSESGFDIAAAPDGSIGVAGTTPVNAANDDIWLGRFDGETGDLLWMKDFGGPAVNSDAALGLAADSQSNFIVVGYKAVSDIDTDIWLRKWDVGGNVVWTQNVIGTGGDRDEARGAAVDGDDNIVVTGEIRNRMNNNGDIWVAKFGP